MAHHLFNQIITHQVSDETGEAATDPDFNKTIVLLKGDGSEGQNNTADLGDPSYKAFQDNSSNEYEVLVKEDTYGNDFSPYYYDNGYWSVDFDGVNDELKTSSSSTDFAFGTGDFTVECFIKNDTKDVTQQAIVGNRNGGNDSCWCLHYFSTANRLQWHTGLTVLAWMDTLTQIGNWYHVAIARAGTTLKLFLNGVETGSYTDNKNYNVNNNLFIGYDIYAGDFNGQISNLRIVKGTALYTSGFTAPSGPLSTTSQSATSSEVKFLGLQSNRFIDNSGSEHTMAVNAGTPKVSTNTPFTQSKTANVGSGFFDGNGDVIYVEETNSDFTFGTGDYEFSCWVYRTVSGVQQTLFGRNSTGNTNVPYIYINSGNKFAVYYGSVIAASTVNVPSNAWCHLVASRVSGTLKLFQDGVEVASVSNTTSLIASGKIAIGNQWSGGTTNAFTGFISDARVRKGSGVTSVTVPTTSLTAETGTELLTCQYSGAVRNVGFLDDSKYNSLVKRIGDATIGTFSPYSAEDGYWSSFHINNSGYYFPHSSDYNLGSGEFTLEFWMNTNTITGTQYICGQVGSGGAGSDTAVQVYISNSDGRLTLYMSHNAASIETPAASISAHTWHFISCVRQSNTLRIYVDGVQKQSGSYTGTVLDSAGGFGIGQTGEYVGSGFQGYISNFRFVVGSCLRDDGTTFENPTTPLVSTGAETKILTAQSNYFKDNSPTGRTATVSNTPRVLPFAPIAPSRSYSKQAVGGSVFLDGSGDRLEYDPLQFSTISNRDFSLEVWWYPINVYGTYPAVFSLGTNGSYSNILNIGINNSSTKEFGIAIVSGYANDFTTGAGSWKEFQWNHLVMSRKNNTYSFFSNGVRLNSASNSETLGTGQAIAYLGSQWWSGSRTLGGYFSGFRLSVGEDAYDATSTTLTVPTAPVADTSNTTILSNFSNAGIFDHTMRNNVTTVGNTRIRTQVKKFGTGSIYFDGTDTVKWDKSTPFEIGTGPFTVECFVYFDGDPNNGGTNGRASLIRDGGGSFVIQRYDGEWEVGNEPTPQIQVAQSVSNQTWYHVALTRDTSNNLRLFINGTQLGSTHSNYTQDFDENKWHLGALNADGSGSRSLTGYMDEIRITLKARYTSNFTPPTATFPNK